MITVQSKAMTPIEQMKTDVFFMLLLFCGSSATDCRCFIYN